MPKKSSRSYVIISRVRGLPRGMIGLRELSFDDFASNLLQHFCGFLRVNFDRIKKARCSELQSHNVLKSLDSALGCALRNLHELFRVNNFSWHCALTRPPRKKDAAI